MGIRVREVRVGCLVDLGLPEFHGSSFEAEAPSEVSGSGFQTSGDKHPGLVGTFGMAIFCCSKCEINLGRSAPLHSQELHNKSSLVDVVP